MVDRTAKSRGAWWKKLLLVAVSTLLTLGMCEGVLRVYFWSKGIGRQDVREVLIRSRSAKLPELNGGAGLFGLVEPSEYPDIVYQLKPHLRGVFRGATVSTNRFGMRGPEITREKPDHTYRIAGIGDSFMFGWGVKQGHDYMAVLQKLLNAHAEPGWKFQVLNFGVPGYNTVMEVSTFEHRVLDFDPDIAVIHFVGNDLYAPHFLAPPPGLAPSHWYLVELVRGLFGRADGDGSLLADADEEDQTGADQPQDDRTPYKHLGGWAQFSKAMQQLGELSRQRHIPVIMMMLAENSRLRQNARDEGISAGLHFMDPGEFFLEIMRKRGLPMTSREFEKTFTGKDAHPNKLGHLAYARGLFCELQSMNVPHIRPTPNLCAPREAGQSQGRQPPRR